MGPVALAVLIVVTCAIVLSARHQKTDRSWHTGNPLGLLICSAGMAADFAVYATRFVATRLRALNARIKGTRFRIYSLSSLESFTIKKSLEIDGDAK